MNPVYKKRRFLASGARPSSGPGLVQSSTQSRTWRTAMAVVGLLGCACGAPSADGATPAMQAPDPSTFVESEREPWQGEAPVPAVPTDEVLASAPVEPTLMDRPVAKLGGVPPTPGRAAVRLRWGSRGCSGVLLNNHTLLTAAHCVEVPIDGSGWLQTSIEYDGPSGLTTWPNTWVHFYIHPDFPDDDGVSATRANDAQNDIAVGHIWSSLGFAESFNFAVVSRKTLGKGMHLTIAGYGAVGFNGTDNRQRRATFDISWKGDKHVKFKVDPSNPQAVVCSGDSGGPHLRYTGFDDSSGPHWEAVAGIHSHGINGTTIDGTNCGNQGRMTRTKTKLSWIEELIELNTTMTCRDFTAPSGEPASWCWAAQ